MLPVLHAGPALWTWVKGVQVPNYSSGLALQAVGVRIRRSRSVALDGILGVTMTLGTAGYTTRNGRSGGIHPAGWQPKRWRP